MSSSTTNDDGGSLRDVNELHGLRALIDQAMSQRGVASGRQLAELAQRHGFALTNTTVNGLRAGTYKSRPREDTVRAIAWLAGVSEDVAFTAAGLRVPGPPFADELPPGVDLLPPKKRKAVINLLRVLIEDEEAMGNAQHPAPTSTPPGVNVEHDTERDHDDPPLKIHRIGWNDGEAHVEDDPDAWLETAQEAGRLAARPGTPHHLPDTTTGEESQDPKEGGAG